MPDEEGRRPAARPKRTLRSTKSVGNFDRSFVPRKPRGSVGRHANVHWCPRCGRRRRECICPAKEAQ